MADITGSVGARGANGADDVRAIQQLLNERMAFFDLAPLLVNGTSDKALIRAIQIYQVRILGHRRPTGLVESGGRTLIALNEDGAPALARERAKALAANAKLSGREWLENNQASFPNSDSVNDLEPAFAAAVTLFIGAIRKARASVRISATRRNQSRAWMMHYAWRLAKEEITTADIPADPHADIIWDHGDASVSRKKAQEMVDFFGIVYKPSLTSNHIAGTAIDMTIGWNDPIEILDAQGNSVGLDRPRNGADSTGLHAVGRTYGVIKLISDRPHWSANGR